MARLYKRSGSPLWYARWTDAKGSAHRESTGTADRKLAQTFLSARVAETVHRRAGLEAATAVALADAFGEFLELHQPPVWSPRWWDTCHRWIKSRIMDDLGGPDTIVADVTRNHAERAQALWMKDVQPPTVNRICSVCSGFFRWAIRQGYALQNPFTGLRRFAETKLTPPELSEEDIVRFLGAIDRGDARNAATLAMDTGLRVSEIRRLAPGDLRGNLLHVVSNYSRGHTKNKRDRWVPLTKRAASAFQAQREAAGAAMFASLPKNYWRLLGRALGASGLPKFRWHDMRHYALSRMASSGMVGSSLKDVAGWTTMQMADRYVHPSLEQAAAAIARMSDCAETVQPSPPEASKDRTQLQDPTKETPAKPALH